MSVAIALRFLLSIVLISFGTAQAGAEVVANGPDVLRKAYTDSQQRLSHNQFGRPLYLNSTETDNEVSGEIYAVAKYPFASASAALKNPANWCEILILHLNTKYCRASNEGSGSVLHVSIGKKFDQPLDDAYRLVFGYRVAAQTSNYLLVKLNADEGPLSTSNYRITLEAIPLRNGQSFIHLSYSYDYGLVSRLAMTAYLNTAGKEKVGFTLVEDKSTSSQTAGGEPRYIGGMRGLVERNTMRYYLAIDTFLGEQASPLNIRFENSINDWFAAAERYPRQLHEIDKSVYLDMKRKEYRRQQGDSPRG